MSKLFIDPKVGDKVWLTHHDGTRTKQTIVDVMAKKIRVSSCNLYVFNRDGSLRKTDSRNGEIKISIAPYEIL